MKSLSSVGLGLSVVFACLFFALIAEIYYLLWWKRRVTGREVEDDYSNPAREVFYIFCWKSKKRAYQLRSAGTLNSHELRITAENHPHQSDNGFQFQTNKDLYLRPYDDQHCVESGLMLGPSRFLFPIKEETREDLESEDGRSKGESNRLSDLMRNAETPYMTPLSSPAFFTPPLTPSIGSSHSRSSSNGYNPFHESSTDVEFNKTRSSPPPQFKFLRDAEEKLLRKNSTMEDAKGEKDGSLVKIIVAKQTHQYQSSSPSQMELQKVVILQGLSSASLEPSIIGHNLLAFGTGVWSVAIQLSSDPAMSGITE